MSDTDAIRKLLAAGSGGNAAFPWFPVGCGYNDWMARCGGHPTDIGTLVRTSRGVFMTGLIGSCMVGQRRADGTLDRTNIDIYASFDLDEPIIEAADPPDCHYTRLPTGAVVVDDPDDNP